MILTGLTIFIKCKFKVSSTMISITHSYSLFDVFLSWSLWEDSTVCGPWREACIPDKTCVGESPMWTAFVLWLLKKRLVIPIVVVDCPQGTVSWVLLSCFPWQSDDCLGFLPPPAEHFLSPSWQLSSSILSKAQSQQREQYSRLGGPQYPSTVE